MLSKRIRALFLTIYFICVYYYFWRAVHHSPFTIHLFIHTIHFSCFFFLSFFPLLVLFRPNIVKVLWANFHIPLFLFIFIEAHIILHIRTVPAMENWMKKEKNWNRNWCLFVFRMNVVPNKSIPFKLNWVFIIMVSASTPTHTHT